MYDGYSSICLCYHRMDEIGTPYCITINFTTLDNNKVIIRDRDITKT